MIRYASSALARALCSVLVLGALGFGLASSAAAQAVSGTILGTVTDSTGAVVPGAKVTIVNEGTGLTRIVVADTNGEYTAPSLPTGHYTITSEMTGFKTVALSNIEVGVDQRVRINIKHRSRRDDRVGQRHRRVAADPDVLLRARHDGRAAADRSAAAQRPQLRQPDAHDPGRAARHSPARTSTAPAASRGAPPRRFRPTASARATTTTCSTASTTTKPGCRRSCIFPSVDALDEFKLQTSTYSAEFGRSLGGVVNLQIKSGTNQYARQRRSSSMRNDAFDANNFFNNRAGRAKPDFKQNQFGGTFGGPMFKDKTFFFGDYQGHREKQGVTALSTVPTMHMRSGDFSELTRVDLRSDHRSALPGQHHPDGRIDSVARKMLKQLYPEPNTAGTRQANGQIINNYLLNPVKNRDDNQFDVKVDHNLTTRTASSSGTATRRCIGSSRPASRTVTPGDVRRRGREHHGTGPGLQRYAHDQADLLNEFRFGWTSIKFSSSRSTTAPTRRRRLDCPASTSITPRPRCRR